MTLAAPETQGILRDMFHTSKRSAGREQEKTPYRTTNCFAFVSAPSSERPGEQHLCSCRSRKLIHKPDVNEDTISAKRLESDPGDLEVLTGVTRESTEDTDIVPQETPLTQLTSLRWTPALLAGQTQRIIQGAETKQGTAWVIPPR